MQCDRLFAVRRGLCQRSLCRCECSYVYNGHAQCQSQYDGWYERLNKLLLLEDDAVTACD